MKSLVKRTADDESSAEGDATRFPQAIVNSVHSLIRRFTAPAMPPGDKTLSYLPHCKPKHYRFPDTEFPPHIQTSVDIPQHSSGSVPEDIVATASQEYSGFQSTNESSSQVVANNEYSSTVTRPGHGPHSSVKSPGSATVGLKAKDARKRSLDPLQRYFSPGCHSFPDYGHIKPTDKMVGGQILKRFNASFAGGPVDTLYSTKTQPLAPPSRATTERLAAKRQKTDHSGAYNSTARFMPIEGLEDALQGPVTGSERRGSQSVASTEEKIYDSGVKEFRAVESLHDPTKRPRGHRSRPARPRLVHLDKEPMEEQDPIEDDSDDSLTGSRVPTRPTAAAAFHGTDRVMNRSADSAELAILGAGGQDSRSIARKDSAHAAGRSKKRMQQSDVYDEVDELANGDYDYRPNKKVNTGLRQRPPVQSSSISRRGDMKPSLANVDKEAPLAKDPLPLKAFSWAPAHFYDSTDISTNDPESGPLTLMSRELDDGHKRAVLFVSDAVHALEPSPKYAWFEVESWKLKTVKVNYDQCLVKLSGPNQLDNHLGAVLYLQFHSKDDTQRMILWVSRYTNEKPKPDPGGVLEKELHNKIAEIKKNEKRPTPMVTPAAKPQVDAEASQPTARLDSALPWRRMQQPRARLIDNMDSSPRVGSGPFGYPVGEEELSVSELRPPRRSGRARRDVLSPGPVHLPDRWTEVHPEWDKDWRLPLSFHRTAVEKDDIARLDEGQCLNDNIIGFYLKYLQVTAEKQRPETSKRVYFHNSFFYSKLKPATGRAINYDGVKNWTAKVDLFSYDYIVVPVNEHFHWWVAIICNPGKLDSSTVDKVAESPESGNEVEEVMAISTSGDGDAQPSLQDADEVVVVQEPPADTVSVFKRLAADARRLAGLQQIHGDDNKEGPSALPQPNGLLESADGDSTKASAELGKDQDATVAVDNEETATTGKSENAASKNRKRGRKSMGPAPRKYDPADPRIITLDSLGASHSPVCTHLKQYLIAEFKDKKGKDIEYNQPSIGMRATNIPEQNNFCDCGVYLLKYVSEFLTDPDKFIQSILLRESWQWDFDASKMRNDIRDLIFELHDPYQKEVEEAKRQKTLAKRKRERSKSQGPVDGSEPVAPQSSVEGAVSPEKLADTIPASPPLAENSAVPKKPAADWGVFLESTQAKESLKARQDGSSVTTLFDNRSFLVVDDKEEKPVTENASAPHLVESSPGQSQPLPSIEVADDDKVSPTFTQQRWLASRQGSLSVGTGSAEGSGDKMDQVQLAGAAPSQTLASKTSHRQKTPPPQMVMDIKSFDGKTAAEPLSIDEVQVSVKSPSPAKKKTAITSPLPTAKVDQGKPEKSPYFSGEPWKQNAQQTVQKKTVSSQTVVDTEGFSRKTEALTLDDDEVQVSTVPPTPAKKDTALQSPKPTTNGASEKSEGSRLVRGVPWKRSEQQKAKATNKASARKTSSGGTIDLTDD